MSNEEKISLIIQAYHDLENQRVLGKKKIHDISKLANEAVFNFEKNNVILGNKILIQMRDAINLLTKERKNYPSLLAEENYRVCLMECMKAELYNSYLVKKEISFPKTKICLEPDEYMIVLCEFIGELIYQIKPLIEQRKYEKVRQVKDTVMNLYALLVNIGPHGILKIKLEEAKKHIRKIEDVLLDVSEKD